MRPIVLEMNGFASFREAARIDFTDADFFALVGPTGSGKSTVIDAMTFALYGSVPRWGRKGMVSLALAPTTSRGTVKLVFEVGDQRYVVARELRRAGSQVSQRAASLERLADRRGRAEPGEPTEVLAKDLAGVADAVERLLGLSYEDFCQCVVLPQGQFADFLHATAGERQEILMRLLGAEHYKRMMIRANQLAGDAAKRAETLDETLATLGDATQGPEDAARANETALARLAERVDAAVPEINAADKELMAAEGDLAQLEQDRAALAAVRVPDDVPALGQQIGAARAALDQARATEELALEDDRKARKALAEGPQRAPLELARQQRTLRDQDVARQPTSRDEAARLSARSAAAEAAVAEADAALEALRAQRDDAAGAAEASERRTRELSEQNAALTAVAVPDGVDRLDAGRRAAAEALAQASAALQAAEQQDSDTRAARDRAAAPGALEQARGELRGLEELIAGRAPARARLQQARDRRAQADTALQEAEAGRQQRQRDVDAARQAHVVAGLRPHLVAGEACPVCEQTVAVLPGPLYAPALDDAQARLDEAARKVTAAQKAALQATSAEQRAAAELDSLTEQRRRRVSALTAAQAGPLSGAGLTAVGALLEHETSPAAQDGQGSAGQGGTAAGIAGPAAAEAGPAAVEGGPAAAEGDPATAEAGRVTAALAEVTASLRARQALDKAANAAADAMAAARARVRSAQAGLDQAQADTAAARGALNAARDPLVPLGAPPAGDAALAAAWAELVGWASGQAEARAAELTEARAAAQAAAGQRDDARERFGRAEADLSRLRAEATRAAKAEQEARTRLAELTGRIAELDRALRDAPDESQVSAQLALLGELEDAASRAGQRLVGTRSNLGQARQGVTGLERAESAARTRLSATRDPLVRLGAPALDAHGLLAGWTALQAWAAAEASARDRDIAPGRERVRAARAGAAQLSSALSADLAARGLELPAEAVAAGAATTVTAALERARAETRRITDRRAQAAGLITRRDAARDEQQVARLLGDLLRSNRFPQWLVTAAVDALVDEASVTLADLTNGQFDLTHEAGEFYVVDHADADSRRSVRTLSGGETFQASLALALALSSQMSTLAAAGAPRLDSIFLDEGFGTLDPETLEVVAATLETLAQGQRMVGVITHVAALAERVPVRFVVSRNTRTSSVTREGPAAPELADAD
jgi:DNA repair protein SbcC/Rad50